jgi:HEAT repeat protein
MDADPPLTVPPMERTLSPRLRPLWLEALGQPDAWTRQQALEAFASAHEQGMPDVISLAPQFIEQLKKPGQHPLVKLEAARTLVRIDASIAAADLMAATLDADVAMILLVDPALARWDHAPARELWLARAGDTASPTPVRISAVQCLAQVKHTAAAPTLKALALESRSPAPLRLAAAAATGTLTPAGLESEAQALVARGTLVDRLVAARLLIGHTARPALDLLVKLASDAEPAVAAIAVDRLMVVQPALLAPLLPAMVKSPDANLRQRVVRHDLQQPGTAGIARLVTLLDDEDDQIRGSSRQALLTLAQDQAHAAAVRSAGMAALTGKGWRAQEQSALLLGSLDHEPAADTLLTLLTHDQHEVRLASIVALRRLAVSTTLPALRAHLDRLMAGPVHPAPAPPAEPKAADGKKVTQTQTDEHRRALAAITQLRTQLDTQRVTELQHLVQVFGVMNDAEAQPALRKFVPKTAGPSLARAAAIWSLGHLHADKADATLVRELVGRLGDNMGMEPEAEEVRAQAAVALGRMKAKSAVGALIKALETGSASNVGQASIWAHQQITGKTPELPKVENATAGTGWFLEPIE